MTPSQELKVIDQTGKHVGSVNLTKPIKIMLDDQLAPKIPEKQGMKDRKLQELDLDHIEEFKPASSVKLEIIKKLPPKLTRDPVSLKEFLKNPRFGIHIEDIRGHIVEFCMDKKGSHFIQCKLEFNESVVRNAVFAEILESTYSLSTNTYGNFVIQHIFKHGTDEQRSALFATLQGKIIELSNNVTGCYVVQTMLESVSKEQKKIIAKELKGHVYDCSIHKHASYVIQKCIKCVELPAIKFFFDEIRDSVYDLSTTCYGNHVVQCIVKNCPDEVKAPIVFEVVKNVNSLIFNKFGFIVLKNILKYIKIEERGEILRYLQGRFWMLSMHKFAAYLVLECIEYANQNFMEMYVNEVCALNKAALDQMMGSSTGRSVLKKLIDLSNEKHEERLRQKLRSCFLDNF